MGGGTSSVDQIANGSTNFNPTMLGASTIYVGGDVGNAGVSQMGSSSATGGSFSLGFGLMNLDNRVDFMRAQDANVNFNGGGSGNNWVGSLDAGSGANINFGLLNLDNNVDFMRA